jgi:dTDP-4-amino-4,6-dideoxygalactose transaminase
VPLIDIEAQDRACGKAVREAVERVLSSHQFILGGEVEQFESAVAHYCDTRYAIGCASGTDALLLALMALGVGPGDEVITTPYSFHATASSIWRTGARPVFVDIDPDSFNLDPALIESHITSQTRAILIVHLFGQCCEMEPIWRLAVQRGLPIIEDAAQSLGAEYRGRRAGVLGTAAAFSFYPTKNLGACGDAGMIVSDDAELTRHARSLRVHGMEELYVHRQVGLCSRLDAIQAAILLAKLPYLERWIRARQRHAARYGELFAKHHLGDVVQDPGAAVDRRHVYHQYVVRVARDQRDALREYLRDHGVGSAVYYPVPLHLQPCFEALGYQRGAFPHAEQAAEASLALPVFPELTPAQQETVVATIAAFFGRGDRRSQPMRRPTFLRDNVTRTSRSSPST